MAEAPLPPFAALRAFEMVGRAGGIRKGAQALGLSHAIVSRHIAALEAQLGTVLLNRRTGALTAAGAAYHARIAAAIAELGAATSAARAPRREELTIWCSPGLSLHWLTRRLPRFAPGRGSAVIDLRASDAEPDFDRHEADGDIRYHPDDAPPPSARAVRTELLARAPVFPVASPDVRARFAASVRTPGDFACLPLIHENSDGEWRGWFAAQGLSADAVPPPVARFGQAHLALAAARAGQGVALTSHLLAAEELAAGSLVRVEPSEGAVRPVALGGYFFRGPAARWHDPLVVRFRRWLAAEIAGDATL